MAQYNWIDIDPDTEDGTELATRLNAFVAAVKSGNKGSSAPPAPTAGQRWVDDSATPWAVKLYDGTDWITEGFYNASTNLFTTNQAAATTSLPGLLSAADKTKLDGIAAGATNTPAIPTVVVLTDGATVALNAALGDFYTLVTTTNPTISPPSNPANGKAITIRISASGGARTVTLSSATGGFKFGAEAASLAVIASGFHTYIGCRYDSTANKWDVVAISTGYSN